MGQEKDWELTTRSHDMKVFGDVSSSCSSCVGKAEVLGMRSEDEGRQVGEESMNDWGISL